MALTKVRLGELIAPVDERNNLGIREFYGVNINKEFMPTAANTEGLDETKYKVVRKNRFVFSGMQTGRDCCIRISMYTGEDPILVSPAYTTFEIKRTDIVSPLYFFMRFLSKEMDRYGAFCSDGSIRSNLDWDVFCDIEIELPELAVQEKFVAVYRAMVANCAAYERGLSDLKLACDAAVEHLKVKYPAVPIGQFLIPSEARNTEKLSADFVRGLSVSKEMIETKANMDGVSVDNYKIVPPGSIAYVADTSRRGDKISLAQNRTNETFLVSSISTVFDTDRNHLLPEFLMLFFARDEFERYARFHSWGSARETFDWDEMCDVKIPIPDIIVGRLSRPQF